MHLKVAGENNCFAFQFACGPHRSVCANYTARPAAPSADAGSTEMLRKRESKFGVLANLCMTIP